MFKNELSDKLKRIFDLKKVSFDLPGESQEQDCAFVEVESCLSKIRPPLQIAKVSGKIKVFGNSDKLPYGYFSKRINSANVEDTDGLFFYAFEENGGTFRNITERSLSFIYFFESQYDPEQGEMTEFNASYTES